MDIMTNIDHITELLNWEAKLFLRIHRVKIIIFYLKDNGTRKLYCFIRGQTVRIYL